MSKLLVDRLKRMGACKSAIQKYSKTRKLSRQLWQDETNARWLLWYAAKAGVSKYYFDILDIDRNDILNNPSSLPIDVDANTVRINIPYDAVIEAREQWDKKNPIPKPDKNNKIKKAQYR